MNSKRKHDKKVRRANKGNNESLKSKTIEKLSPFRPSNLHPTQKKIEQS